MILDIQYQYPAQLTFLQNHKYICVCVCHRHIDICTKRVRSYDIISATQLDIFKGTWGHFQPCVQPKSLF